MSHQEESWTPLRAAEMGNLQLERQLRLLIEGVEAFLDVNNWATLGELKARVKQNLEDRLETAKGYLS